MIRYVLPASRDFLYGILFQTPDKNFFTWYVFSVKKADSKSNLPANKYPPEGG